MGPNCEDGMGASAGPPARSTPASLGGNQHQRSHVHSDEIHGVDRVRRRLLITGAQVLVGTDKQTFSPLWDLLLRSRLDPQYIHVWLSSRLPPNRMWGC